MPSEQTTQLQECIYIKRKREVLSMGFTKGMAAFGGCIHIYIYIDIDNYKYYDLSIWTLDQTSIRHWTT